MRELMEDAGLNFALSLEKFIKPLGINYKKIPGGFIIKNFKNVINKSNVTNILHFQKLLKNIIGYANIKLQIECQ